MATTNGVGQQAVDAIELFVPGRLCLLGEHSDWAGGMRKYNREIRPGRTIVVGTEQGLHARARRLEAPVLRLRCSTDGGQVVEAELPLDPAALAEQAAGGGFWSYAAGTAYKMVVEHGVGGLLLDNHKTTLPLKKGLSSSAALCVLLARAFNRLYGLRLTTRGEMEVAYVGERLTPSQCGRMDQAVAYGDQPVIMVYDGDLLTVEPAALSAPLHFVLVDLCASKDTPVILAALQAAYPHPAAPEHAALHRLLGETNERLTAAALEAMAAGDAARLGSLLTEAQREFDAAASQCCPSQLASPVLHAVLAHPPLQRLVLGGKGVGSQGDGTAQLLSRDAASQEEACVLLARDLGVRCMAFTVPPTTSGGTLPSSRSSSASALAATAATREELQAAAEAARREALAAGDRLQVAQQLWEEARARLAELERRVAAAAAVDVSTATLQ